MKKKKHFLRFSKIVRSTLKIVLCILSYLNMVDKPQQTSISLFCGQKSFTTIPNFGFVYEILKISLMAFVKDFLFFKKEEHAF